MKTVTSTNLKKQITKNLDCKIKAYSLIKLDNDIGQHVLKFKPTRIADETSKLNGGFSLTFKFKKANNKIGLTFLAVQFN